MLQSTKANRINCFVLINFSWICRIQGRMSGRNTGSTKPPNSDMGYGGSTQSSTNQTGNGGTSQSNTNGVSTKPSNNPSGYS